LILDSVEFVNMGQKDTELAGLDFRYNEYTDADEESVIVKNSIVTNSAFHTCGGFCAGFEHVKGVSLINNVLYNCERHLINIYKSHMLTITDNALIGARKRDDIS